MREKHAIVLSKEKVVIKKEDFEVPPDEMFTMAKNGRKYYIDADGNTICKAENGKAVINKAGTLMTIYRIVDGKYHIERYKLAPKKRIKMAI